MVSTVINNAAAVRIIWNWSGSPYAVNTFTVIKQGVAPSISQGSANDLAAAVKTAYDASTLRTQMFTAIAPATVGVRDLDQPNQPEYLASTAALAGTSASEPLPLQTAFCVTLRTALAGASYRGRSYISGYTEGVGNGGSAAAAVGTAAVAWIQALQTQFNNKGFTLAVGSRKTGQAKEVTQVVQRNLLWDTQRRRAGAASI